MYILAGIPHATTLIAPPVSGVLMNIQIWVPFAVALVSLGLSLLLVLIMPESLNHPANGMHKHEPLLGPADTLDENESEEEEEASTNQLPRGIHDRLPETSPSKREWWRDIITLLEMPGLPFCYFLFLFKPMAMISKAYVYQYASWNFQWQLAQTTWLRFAQAGGSTIATIVVLPLLTSLLNRRGLQAQILDVNVIRISLCFAVIGFLVLQFSFFGWMLVLGKRKSFFPPYLGPYHFVRPNVYDLHQDSSLIKSVLKALFICGLSEGQEPALQGLTTSLIDRAYHARLFTSVAALEILAKLVGGPIMGKLFAITKRDGQGSMGISFSVSAVSLLPSKYQRQGAVTNREVSW